MAEAAQLELALDRALRDAGEPKSYADDAGVVVKVLRRWYGDEAGKVLRAAAEMVENQS